jgi:hypothetical protein
MGLLAKIPLGQDSLGWKAEIKQLEIRGWFKN